MQWSSVGDFFAMGGYALYVWGSLGACAFAMVIEPWLVRRRHGAALREVRMHGRLAQRRVLQRAEAGR